MKGLKKLLAMVLSLAMVLTMVSFTAFADDAATSDAKPGVSSTLGMFTIASATVTVNDDATVTAEFTTVGTTTVSYPKIAFVEQTATDAEKEAAAISAESMADDHSATYKITRPVTDLGKALAVSFYQEKNGSGEWHNFTGMDKDGNVTSDPQKYLTIENTADVVSQLIDKIYVQSRNEYTDTMCAQAKASWDALTEEEQQNVDPYDYFGVDTGDGTADDPLNQDNIGSKELLVVSFGTSFNGSRVATIGAIEKTLAEKYPEYSVRRAFTAQIIINHIQAREGYKIDNVDEAIQRAIDNNVKELVIQPTHLMTGAEYDELREQIDAYKSEFDSIKYAYPLCKTDADKSSVVDAVTTQAASDAGLDVSALSADNADTAFVFMGHGTAHEANVTYALMQNVIDQKGLKNCFIGTVEGKPESTELSVVLNKIKEAGYKKVILRPLMVVAGDHANNDMAGDDEDSWKSAFLEAGLEVETQIHGLGEISAIRDMYVQHTANAIDGVAYDEKLDDGNYTLTATTDSSMIKIAVPDKNTCQYVVKDGKGTVTLRLNGQAISKLYLGTATAAAAVSEDNYINAVADKDGYLNYTFELNDLGQVNVACYSTKSGKWLDHVFTFTNPAKNNAADNAAAENAELKTQVEEAKADVAEAKADAAAAKADTATAKAETAKYKAAVAKYKAALAKYKAALAKSKINANAVKNVKAKAVSGHKVTVSFKKFTAASGYTYAYQIWRSTKSSSGFKKVATTKALKATVKGQTKGKTYYFKVRAYTKVSGKVCYSKYSSVVKVKAK